MKRYEFPYGGSFGKGDSWDGVNEVELTDEEAARLEASARRAPRWHLDEDSEISDINDKVYKFLYNHDIETLMNDHGWIEERRSDRECDGERPVSDRELVEEYMEGTSFHVCYPVELQDLEKDSENEK